jgi:2,3-bisphosphoglycerate-independent phosphoglycerate mutase
MRTVELEFLASLSIPSPEKILLVVIDGLGGLRHPDFGNQTELEYGSRQGMLENLAWFVRHEWTATGLIYPVARGIIPGSGTGHLGLFGYDPVAYNVKRGAIEAAGAAHVPPADIVARLNFCKMNSDGLIIDRRANRLGCSPTRGLELAQKLNAKFRLPGIEAVVIATRDHRGILALRRKDESALPLDDGISDTDPGDENKPVAPCTVVNPRNQAAVKTAEAVRLLTQQAGEILAREPDANTLIFRGFAQMPNLPSFEDVFSVRPAAIALYPTYRGVAKLVGMSILDGGAKDLKDEVDLLDKHYADFDFFYLHYKKPDMMGEDKNFLGKVEALAEFDRLLPRLIGDERFSVIAITGDHSTPSVLGRHSEHSVPLAIHARTMKGYNKTQYFTEGECIHGSLGRLRGVELMPILLAKAGKLRKFGA